jgi:hypothetical protein
VVRRRARQKRAHVRRFSRRWPDSSSWRCDLGRAMQVGAGKHRRPHARARSDPCRAARCCSGRGRPDEQRGRLRPVPRRANRRQPPDAHLREARDPIENRAGTRARLTSKVQTF